MHVLKTHEFMVRDSFVKISLTQQLKTTFSVLHTNGYVHKDLVAQYKC